MEQISFPVESDEPYRVCSRCGRMLPVSMFRTSKYKLKTGEPAECRYRYCAECMSDDHRKRYAENRDRYKGHILEFTAKYGTYYQQRKRAKQKGLSHDLTLQEIDEMNEYFDGECAWCGKRLTREDRSYDHLIPIKLGGGFTKRNIVPACRNCNSRHTARTWREWYKGDENYNPDRESKIIDYISQKEERGE